MAGRRGTLSPPAVYGVALGAYFATALLSGLTGIAKRSAENALTGGLLALIVLFLAYAMPREGGMFEASP